MFFVPENIISVNGFSGSAVAAWVVPTNGRKKFFQIDLKSFVRSSMREQGTMTTATDNKWIVSG